MLQEFLQRFKEKESVINQWLEEKRKLVGPEPLYASVDLRNAGFKIVPVDTNLFPAGWNNLCPNYGRQAAEYFKNYFDTYFPGTKCLLIIPENHTRNLYYFSSLKRLKDILAASGFEVKIGTLNPELTESENKFLTQENEEIVLQKITREGDNLFVGDKRICQVVINNDFSVGIPEILHGVKENLLPSPEIGWHQRKKSDHFAFYHQLIQEFAEVIGIDSWFFESHYSVVDDVDFDDEASREKAAQAVDALIQKIAVDYEKHKIQGYPSVFIKNNAGTYGMAVIRVNSGDDVRKLNQQNRKQMRVGKGSVDIKSVILQEGVVTVERIKDLVAEPVIYLVGNKSVGGFYRLNDEKGDNDNLNSKGMQFAKSCFHENIGYENLADPTLKQDDLTPIYKVIAAIASLASGYELKALKQK
ncbi:MAG: glutamate--cysteine ligase [Candidatus Gracilibacteria bacterium]|jgi:glutamate--cysteine ligase